MQLHLSATPLRGAVDIPGSKSHTIRAVAIAALADGQSRITAPLDSADARAAFTAYTAFGAAITEAPGEWRVQGIAGAPRTPDNIVDVGNSGTTMNFALGTAALLPAGLAVLTGDEQVRRRPNGPLAQALRDLGARCDSTRGTGTPPFVVGGPLRGGEATMQAMTSQYVSSILLNAPLAEGDTTLHVPLMHEKPYAEMTLDWLKRQGIRVDHDDDLSEFHIPGRQRYAAFDRRIPGDFSSATFFLCAGALPGNEVLCRGLDLTDTQGDKAVVDYLRAMGAEVSVTDEGIRVKGNQLHGEEIDLNATPDALPMMAVLACFAEGTTRLVNVPQARLKETDRIAVMRQELSKLGAQIEEREDGLVIHRSDLTGGAVEGHGDHRVVMSLAIAGTRAAAPLTIHGYEAVNITFPTFYDALTGIGGAAQLQP